MWGNTIFHELTAQASVWNSCIRRMIFLSPWVPNPSKTYGSNYHPKLTARKERSSRSKHHPTQRAPSTRDLRRDSYAPAYGAVGRLN